MVKLRELEDYANRLLGPERFKDYCPNGVQVEGRPQVGRLVSGVTACEALLAAAVERGADAVLVHHGLFWRGGDPRVVGMMRRRLALLLKADISLLAYHLPLDAHPELGNNARLAALLGLSLEDWFGEQRVGALGSAPGTPSFQALAARVETALGRKPLAVGDPDRPIRRAAWCSGGAQDYIVEAASLGADVFITGEVSERTVHEARELGIAFLACGHHATERYGVRALGEHLAATLGLEHQHVDVDNPA